MKIKKIMVVFLGVATLFLLLLSVKFIEVRGRRIKKKPLLCNRAGKH